MQKHSHACVAGWVSEGPVGTLRDVPFLSQKCVACSDWRQVEPWGSKQGVGSRRAAPRWRWAWGWPCYSWCNFTWAQPRFHGHWFQDRDIVVTPRHGIIVSRGSNGSYGHGISIESWCSCQIEVLANRLLPLPSCLGFLGLLGPLNGSLGYGACHWQVDSECCVCDRACKVFESERRLLFGMVKLKRPMVF